MHQRILIVTNVTVDYFMFRLISNRSFTITDQKKGVVYPFWIAMHLLDVFLMCYMADSTRNEAKKTGSILHRLAHSFSDIGLKKQVNNIVVEAYFETFSIGWLLFSFQIKSFSIRLLNNRIIFFPLGLFELDLHFMSAVNLTAMTHFFFFYQNKCFFNKKKLAFFY